MIPQEHTQELERFQPSHVPPAPPASQHFSLQLTTLFVESIAPHQIGNSLLDFLDSQVVASISKVRPRKFSLRADVLEVGILCSLKVRVYQVSGAPVRYAIEFQRRSGCALTFQRV